MTKTAILSFDVPTINGRAGGVGTFVAHLSTLLRDAGEDVTIILTRLETSPVSIDADAKARYAAMGIKIIEVHNPRPLVQRWPVVLEMRLSEFVTPHLADFDVIYMQDWASAGFHAIRTRRFNPNDTSVFVNVLHGAAIWERGGNQLFPRVVQDLNTDYVERYTTLHSDFVLAPSDYIREWVTAHGWRLPTQTRVIGLPIFPAARGGDSTHAPDYKRLIYFGRLETRKGFELTVDALKLLAKTNPETVKSLEQVVFLGSHYTNSYRNHVDQVWSDLKQAGYNVEHRGDLASPQALDFLAEHAHESLIVIPSLSDNFPYTVIETTLIPGVHLLCARTGGIPEILGANSDSMLFDPYPRAFAAALEKRLGKPASNDVVPTPYDYAAANARYLDFHREAAELAASKKRTVHPAVVPSPVPSVDICVTYYNKGAYLIQLLDCLAHQTSQDFSVYIIDDGSTDPESIAIFDRMQAQYAPRGWTFVRQENQWVDAARNTAAQLGKAEYLLFIDSDDIPTLNTVARYLQAIRTSGDDLLTCGSYLFVGDNLPFSIETGEITAPPFAFYMPLGANLVAGLLEPIIFGSPMIIVRRRAFEAIGGYREWRGAQHEDWELHARLALAGYKTDVVPEYLQFYRQVETGLARTSDQYRAKQRIIEAYEERLAQVGMRGAAWAFYGMYNQLQELRKRKLNVETEMRLVDTPFHLFQQGWANQPTVDERMPITEAMKLQDRVIDRLRNMYRDALPLETRLRLHARVMKLLGRKVDLTP